MEHCTFEYITTILQVSSSIFSIYIAILLYYLANRRIRLDNMIKEISERSKEIDNRLAKTTLEEESISVLRGFIKTSLIRYEDIDYLLKRHYLMKDKIIELFDVQIDISNSMNNRLNTLYIVSAKLQYEMLGVLYNNTNRIHKDKSWSIVISGIILFTIIFISLIYIKGGVSVIDSNSEAVENIVTILFITALLMIPVEFLDEYFKDRNKNKTSESGNVLLGQYLNYRI